MAAVDDDDPGFWPGYVAAVSGLVQGLLIMAMALATAILALGQLAKGPPPRGGVNAMPPSGAMPAGFVPPPAAPPPAALPPALLPEPATRLVPVGALPARASGMAAPAAALAALPRPAISAGFQGDAVSIPVSATGALLASVDAARDEGAKRWRISIAADLHDPRQQRAAYLRLLGLRALMVQHGLAAGSIDLWIESGDAGEISHEARIDPLDASGAPFLGERRP